MNRAARAVAAQGCYAAAEAAAHRMRQQQRRATSAAAAASDRGWAQHTRRRPQANGSHHGCGSGAARRGAAARTCSSSSSSAAAAAAAAEQGEGQEGASTSALQRERYLLQRFLDHHRQLYHSGAGAGEDGAAAATAPGADPVSDEEYDAVMRRLSEVKRVLAGAGAGADGGEVFGEGVHVHGGVVGARPRGGGAGGKYPDKVRHRRRMLSLASCTDTEGVEEFMRKCASKAGVGDPPAMEGGWVVEPKVDGLAVRVEYRLHPSDALSLFRRASAGTPAGPREVVRFVLSVVATRGDGDVGEDVTGSFLAATDAREVPREFSVPAPEVILPGRGAGGGDGEADACIEVRGEVFMSLTAFGELRRAQEAADAGGAAGDGAAGPRRRPKQLISPRNIASGTLRLLDADEARGRRLSFFPYDLQFFGLRVAPLGEGAAGGLHSERMDWLARRQHRGEPAAYRLACADAAEVVARCAELLSAREGLDFEIDGVVVKANSLGAQSRLGATTSEPRHSIALKEPGSTHLTTLRDIEVTIGKSGAIVPVAVLEPVAIRGVTCTRASLHNVGIAERMGLRRGDKVMLTRAGDVIPQIVRVLKELRPPESEAGGEGDWRGDWRAPRACPWCGSGLVRQSPSPGGRRAAAGDAGRADPVLCCPSAPDACPGQALRLLEHFVSVLVPNVSKGIVEQLYDAKVVRGAADLFRLERAALLGLPGWKESRADIFLAGVAASRGAPPAKILSALGIRHVGANTANVLAARYGSLEGVSRALGGGGEGALLELQELEGVGRTVATSVRDWFAAEANRALVDDLVRLGVGGAQGAARRGSRLHGVTVAMTGGAPGATRAQVRAMVEDLGGVFSGSVTRKCTILVVGEGGSRGKIDRAEELQLRVLDWERFRREFDIGSDDKASDPP